MPFKPGTSGNPLGRPRRRWIGINEKDRVAEARKTWERLLRLRDHLVLERKHIGTDKDGEPVIADVVPSAKDYIACCKEILESQRWNTADRRL
jgi:hypothetical protein